MVQSGRLYSAEIITLSLIQWCGLQNAVRRVATLVVRCSTHNSFSINVFLTSIVLLKLLCRVDPAISNGTISTQLSNA